MHRSEACRFHRTDFLCRKEKAGRFASPGHLQEQTFDYFEPNE
jgi:hypothetical protein